MFIRRKAALIFFAAAYRTKNPKIPAALRESFFDGIV